MVLEARKLKNIVPVLARHLGRTFLLNPNMVEDISEQEREHHASLGLSFLIEPQRASKGLCLHLVLDEASFKRSTSRYHPSMGLKMNSPTHEL